MLDMFSDRKNGNEKKREVKNMGLLGCDKMSRFYGTVQGSRSVATRTGHKGMGMETHCASWSGAVRCYAYVNEEYEDCVRVELVNWKGKGGYKLLYDGEFKEDYEMKR